MIRLDNATINTTTYYHMDFITSAAIFGTACLGYPEAECEPFVM